MILYLPGTGWGLTEIAPGKTQGWAADELGPIGPSVELRAAFLHQGRGSPQYPLFHYLVLAFVSLPYLLIHKVLGSLFPHQAAYSFEFLDPVNRIHGLALLARYVSVLMGAGTVVMAYLTGKAFWDRRAGSFAGIFVMLMYPMFYYARTSNVDVPALFWVSAAILAFSKAMVDGLTRSRAILLGCLAALAIATKDQNYAVLLLLPLALLVSHSGRLKRQEESSLSMQWQAPAWGFLASVVVYVVASGLAINPGKFLFHVTYIRSQGGGYFRYPPTLEGYGNLVLDGIRFVIEALSWPIFIAGVIGILICLARKHTSSWLLLVVPGFFLGAIFPVRSILFRFVLAWAYITACFAGYAFSRWASSRQARIALAAAVMVVLFPLARGVELTVLMLHGGSRVEATEWFARHLRPSDRVEYFGWMRRVTFLPRLPNGATYLYSTATALPESSKLAGDFVILVGETDGVPEDLHLGVASPGISLRPGCPDWIRMGLKNGSLGYLLAARVSKPTFFPHFGVNPGIEIYVRRNRVENGPGRAGSP